MIHQISKNNITFAALKESIFMFGISKKETIRKEKYQYLCGAMDLDFLDLDEFGTKAYLKGFELFKSRNGKIRNLCHVPLIASGGAGTIDDFIEVFQITNVNGALAASVFHNKILTIKEIKLALNAQNIEVRL